MPGSHTTKKYISLLFFETLAAWAECVCVLRTKEWKTEKRHSNMKTLKKIEAKLKIRKTVKINEEQQWKMSAHSEKATTVVCVCDTYAYILYFFYFLHTYIPIPTFFHTYFFVALPQCPFAAKRQACRRRWVMDNTCTHTCRRDTHIYVYIYLGGSKKKFFFLLILG